MNAPTRARDCRDLNDRNGVLVGAQIKRVEGLLGAITGTSAEPRAYGPRGQSNPYATAPARFSPPKPELLDSPARELPRERASGRVFFRPHPALTTYVPRGACAPRLRNIDAL